MQIGDKLRQLRIYKGLSQVELAAGICSTAYLSKVENGKTSPSASFLEKVTKKLEVESSAFGTEKTAYYVALIQQLEKKVRQEEGLTEKEISTLHLALYEILSMDLQVKVFNLLMKYYISNTQIADAQRLYELCEKIIPMETNVILEDMHDVFVFYNLLGNYFYSQQQFHSADYYYTKAKDYGSKSRLELAKIFYNLSLTKQRIFDDMHISLIYAKQAYELFEQEEQYAEVIDVLISMAIQYTYNENFEEAKSSLQLAFDHLNEYPGVRQNTTLFMLEYHWGRLDEAMGNEEAALQRYVALADTLEEHAPLVYVLKSLVDLYFTQKQWVQVQAYSERAMALAERFQMNYIYIQLMTVRANMLKMRQDEIGYEKEMKKALLLAKEHVLGKLVKEIAQTLGDYYMELRFYKKSSEYYREALQSLK
ncbi:helix-turn-helix transcriptional regulator [Lysinibacillus sp. KU-BSD001]|uniref:helix-turn-helix domain-containing protein n=1 Tax=Lysinibacillus sp. KU-BSD001 TaxID=3141328 RepID=UPI0036E5D0BF